MANDVSALYLKRLLQCNFADGTLTWRHRTPEMFSGTKYSASRACKTWNARMAGKPAFTAELKLGYKVGRIFQSSYRAHRVIWAMFYGQWPDLEIDHIDGNPRNNSINNLREVCAKDNRRNMRLYSTNKSGVHGVTWSANAKKWHARISSRTGVVNLGYFSDLDDAIRARKKAENLYGYHSNHGRIENLLTKETT